MGASKDDYQSAQKALTERRGIKLSAAHVGFTACCCAFASQCAKKPMLAYTAAGIGCGLMVLGRCGTTYYLLLTAYYLLLTAYCLLLTTYYLLLTAYYLPHGAGTVRAARAGAALLTSILLLTTHYLLPGACCSG